MISIDHRFFSFIFNLGIVFKNRMVEGYKKHMAISFEYSAKKKKPSSSGSKKENVAIERLYTYRGYDLVSFSLY